MTTETILTPAQVDSLLEGVLRASGSRLGNYTYQKTLDDLHSSIRAIEQAVLQSPEVQALRKDAGRYRYLSGRDDASATGVGCWLERNGEALECGWLYGDQLDATIDAAMEQQT